MIIVIVIRVIKKIVIANKIIWKNYQFFGIIIQFLLPLSILVQFRRDKWIIWSIICEFWSRIVPPNQENLNEAEGRDWKTNFFELFHYSLTCSFWFPKDLCGTWKSNRHSSTARCCSRSSLAPPFKPVPSNSEDREYVILPNRTWQFVKFMYNSKFTKQ